MRLSSTIIRLFKNIVPPHELVEMLHLWFGKEEREIRQLMSKHGFSEEHVQELWQKSGLSSVTKGIEKEVINEVNDVLPEVEEISHEIGNEISKETVQTLAKRLQIKGLNHTAITHIFSSCGFTAKELEHIVVTETRNTADPKRDGKILVFNTPPDAIK